MHESVRLTGMHRTYPNWVASEAARGNEFNAWSVGNQPFHETVLPFTRFMGGPMDYTPGIFKIKMNHYNKDKKNRCILPCANNWLYMWSSTARYKWLPIFRRIMKPNPMHSSLSAT